MTIAFCGGIIAEPMTTISVFHRVWQCIERYRRPVNGRLIVSPSTTGQCSLRCQPVVLDRTIGNTLPVKSARFSKHRITIYGVIQRKNQCGFQAVYLLITMHQPDVGARRRLRNAGKLNKDANGVAWLGFEAAPRRGRS